MLKLHIVKFVLMLAVVGVSLSGCGGGGSATDSVTSDQSSSLSISEQPVAPSVVDGQSARMSVKVSGASSASYQWQRNGADIVGANGTTYATESVTLTNSGDVYVVRITDGKTTVTSQPITLTVKELPKVAEGGLSSNVRVLTNAEAAQIISSTSSEITFSGSFTLSVGGVVLTPTQAFKVVSSRSSGGNTIFTVADPDLSEIFDTLRISGTYRADASSIVASATPSIMSGRVTPQAYTISETFTNTASLSYGGMTTTVTEKQGLSATIDYSYVRSKGGLQSARFDVDSANDLTLAINYTAKALAQAEKQIARYRIPVNVTIVDAALNVVGVRVVSVQVPVYLGIRADTEFALGVQGTVSMNGGVHVRYDQNTGSVTSTAAYSAGFQLGPIDVTTPAGATALTTHALTGSVYLRTAPGLVFLNTVAMLGVDTTLSSDNKAQLQVISASPFYCLSFVPEVNVSANGYLKGVGFSEVKTKEYKANLYKGDPKYQGNCQAPTVVSGSPTNVSATTQGYDVTVRASVALDPKASSKPSTAPSGSVKISSTIGSCTIKLTVAGTIDTQGSCTLPVGATASGAALQINYSGDSNYAPSTGSLDVALPASTGGLMGAPFSYRADYPSLGIALTNVLSGRVGAGVEISSGDFTVVQSGRALIGTAVDLGADYIDLQFTQTAQASFATFNGEVIQFSEDSPVIRSCTLGSRSDYTASQVGLSCSAHQVLINASGIYTRAGTHIFVQLGF